LLVGVDALRAPSPKIQLIRPFRVCCSVLARPFARQQ
jgi:hypothetical protein